MAGKAKATEKAPEDQGHHPGFTVLVGLSSFYNWEELQSGEKPGDDEEVSEAADGRKGVRREREKDTYTAIQFSAGAFDLINQDREAAGLGKQSFNRMVAEHIEDAQMPHHAPRDAWLWIACPALPDTEAFLQAAFDLPGPPADNVMFNPPKKEEDED